MTTKTRLDPDARRDQLVAAGLGLMQATSFDRVTAATVAKAAGVSKGLVFHYFATQRDLHAAVLDAAAADLLARLQTDPSLPPAERLRHGIDSFLAFIEQHPANYQAMARGAGADPLLQATFERTRQAIVGIILDALGISDPSPALRIALRGWISLVDESSLHWLADQDLPRAELVDFFHRTAVYVIGDGLGLPNLTLDT